jgi:hypothetical protein
MLIVIPVVAGVMVLIGSVCLAVAYVRSRAKDDAVAQAPPASTRQETPIQKAPVQTNQANAFGGLKAADPWQPARPPVGQQPEAEPPQQSPSPALPMPIQPAPPPAKPVPLPPADPLEGIEVGNRAPEIKGQDIDRKAFKLSDYKGKVVLLDFWGYW